MEYKTLSLELEQNFYQIKVITMMKNYDQTVEINHNPNWSYIPDHPYRILIIGLSGSGKTNVLSNLININDQILTKFIYTSKIHPIQIKVSIAY